MHPRDLPLVTMHCIVLYLLAVAGTTASSLHKLSASPSNTASGTGRTLAHFTPQIVPSRTDQSVSPVVRSLVQESTKDFRFPRAYSYRIKLFEETTTTTTTTTTTKKPDNLLFSTRAENYDSLRDDNEIKDSFEDFIDPDTSDGLTTDQTLKSRDTDDEHYYYDTGHESCFPYCNLTSILPKVNDTIENGTFATERNVLGNDEGNSNYQKSKDFRKSDELADGLNTLTLNEFEGLNNIDDEFTTQANVLPEQFKEFVDFQNTDISNSHQDQYFSDAGHTKHNQHGEVVHAEVPSSVRAGYFYPVPVLSFPQDDNSNHLVEESTVDSSPRYRDAPYRTSAHSHRQQTPQSLVPRPANEQISLTAPENEVLQPRSNIPANFRPVPSIQGLRYIIINKPPYSARNNFVAKERSLNFEGNSNDDQQDFIDPNNSKVHVISANVNGMFVTETDIETETTQKPAGLSGDSEVLSSARNLAAPPTWSRAPQYFSGHNGAFLVRGENQGISSTVPDYQNPTPQSPSFFFESENSEGIVQGLPGPPIVISNGEEDDDNLQDQKYIIYQNSFDSQLNFTTTASSESDSGPFLNESAVNDQAIDGYVDDDYITPNETSLGDDSDLVSSSTAGTRSNSGLEEENTATDDIIGNENYTESTDNGNFGGDENATDFRSNLATNTYYVKAGDAAIPIILLADDRFADGSYKFEYESADGSIRKEIGNILPQGGIEQIGRYEYSGDDGRLRQVEYRADEGGFRQRTALGPKTDMTSG